MANYGMGIRHLGAFSKGFWFKKILVDFTKWVEAVLLINIDDYNVKTLLWENIVNQFGIPTVLVSNIGTSSRARKSSSLVRNWEFDKVFLVWVIPKQMVK